MRRQGLLRQGFKVMLVILFLAGCNTQPSTPVSNVLQTMPRAMPQPTLQTMPRAMPTAIPAAAVPRTIGDVLAGHRWTVQSGSLVNVSLVADFYQGGRFDAIVNPSINADFTPKRQQISGRWYIAGSLLILKYNWIDPQIGSVSNEDTIQITDLSRNKLEGVSAGYYEYHLWEFDRTDDQ